MLSSAMTRRAMLKGTGAMGAAMAVPEMRAAMGQTATMAAEVRATPEQMRRMAWWHEARFGMFIHWGLYCVHARHEWAMEEEAIPVTEYQRLAAEFRPVPHAARAWAKLAKAAGMKYMVMTTKHHEGFCLWDSKLTSYNYTAAGANAMQGWAKRDLVRE